MCVYIQVNPFLPLIPFRSLWLISFSFFFFGGYNIGIIVVYSFLKNYYGFLPYIWEKCVCNLIS